MKLYVGNLPYKTTQADLEQMFSQAGAVTSATIITDKFSGRSRGFGFVEMASDEDGHKAVETFNGQEMEGRKLVVNEARPMQARAPRSGGYDRGGRGGDRGDRF